MTLFQKRPGLALAGMAVLAAAMPVAVLSYRAVPLVVGLGVLLLVLSRGRKGGAVSGFDPVLTAALSALVALAVVSLAWTLDLRSSAGLLAAQVLLMLVFAVAAWWAAPRIDPGRLGITLAVVLAVGAALLIFEMQSNLVLRQMFTSSRFNPAKINQAAVVLAIWVWPVLALLLARGRRWPALALWALALVAVLLSDSESAKLALVVGSATAVLFLWPARILPVLLVAGTLLLVAVQPWFPDFFAGWLTPRVSQEVQGAHAYERLVIWQAFAHAAAMKPWLGFGFGSSGWIGQGALLDSFPEPLRAGIVDSHPHDMLLQVWVELGAAGAALLALLLGRAAWLSGTLGPALRPHASAAFVTALLVALVGYGAWQAWWMAALAGYVALLRAAELALAGEERELPRPVEPAGDTLARVAR